MCVTAPVCVCVCVQPHRQCLSCARALPPSLSHCLYKEMVTSERMTLSVSLSFFLSVSLNVGTWERMTLSLARARQGKDGSLSLSKRGSRGEDDSLSRARALSINAGFLDADEARTDQRDSPLHHHHTRTHPRRAGRLGPPQVLKCQKRPVFMAKEACSSLAYLRYASISVRLVCAYNRSCRSLLCV